MYSTFISGYKKILWFKSCLIRTYRKLGKNPDNKNFAGTVLMDLSKVFDSIPHDLLSARLHVHSYLKRRK